MHIKAPAWMLGARAMRPALPRRSHGLGGRRGGKARKHRNVPESNARTHNTHPHTAANHSGEEHLGETRVSSLHGEKGWLEKAGWGGGDR